MALWVREFTQIEREILGKLFPTNRILLFQPTSGTWVISAMAIIGDHRMLVNTYDVYSDVLITSLVKDRTIALVGKDLTVEEYEIQHALGTRHYMKARCSPFNLDKIEPELPLYNIIERGGDTYVR